MNNWIGSAADVFIGAVIAIAFAIFVENLRRPRLRISIGPSADLSKGEIEFRSLRLQVYHKPLWWPLRWMLRGPASQCRALLSFHHLDGQNYFGRSIRARWCGSPEPVQLGGMNQQGVPVFVLDPARVVATSRMDIYPGETEGLDVAVRFSGETECYGWNNETYLQPDWKNADWRLPAGRYLVRASVIASGETWVNAFRLVNDVELHDLRLERATRRDKNTEGLALKWWHRGRR